MNILWIIAAFQAAWVGYVWSTGRITLGNFANSLVIDRGTQPRLFKLFVVAGALTVPILIAAALFPSFAN